MSKELVISASPHETRVAILEEGQLCEYYVEREKEFALVGSIYKGRVTRVLPGMQSAFVEIGLDSDAFLYVTDFLEEIEELDHIVATVEDKVEKMEEQGGSVFAASGASEAAAQQPPDVEPFRDASEVSGEPSEVSGGDAVIPAASSSVAAAPIAGPREYRSPTPDRGRQEHGQRGQRDFGRHGQGQRGRYGRRGGRGNERPRSRELPSSKYASPRPHEDHSPEQAPPAEGYSPVILPGESFAKYRAQTQSPAPFAAPFPAAENTAIQPFQEAVTSAAPHADPIHDVTVETPGSNEASYAPKPSYIPELRAPSPSIMGPLPGETISKWQRRESIPEERSEAAAPPALNDEQQEGEGHESAGSHMDIPHTELTEEEATAVAEHVADIKIEEAEREQEERGLPSAEETSDQAAHESEESEIQTDAEVEEDEIISEGIAQAEAEAQVEIAAGGPILPPAESGIDSPSGAEEVQTQGTQSQGQQPWKARVRNDSRSHMQHPGRRDRGRRDDRDRGRRPQHGQSHSQGHHRPQTRRPQLIADMLKQGQEIIVQIAKEPLGKKGARITSHVALPGRFLVYMPTLDHTGVSRKIASAEDRARLRHLVNEAKGTAGGGFIVRTAAGSAAPEEVRADVEFLTRTWSEIKARSEQRKAPSLLHRDLNLVERILRDYMSSDFSAIWVDSEEEYTKVVDFMSRFQPKLVDRVKLYTKDTPVFEEFGIQQEIDKGLRPKVWLKSGGYIVINHTEALVAIDVNTGKFVGKGSNRLEDTIVRTNVEAVKEIVRQMRLRDLGGIIVIDFIDMEERRNREKVMAALEDALRVDRAPSKVLRFNEFGLVAITRKRTKQALERTLCQPCPYCTGSGMVKSIATLCYEIQAEARKMAPEAQSGSLTLRVHPEISKALKTREAALIDELERWTKKSLIIQADPTLHWEQYDIY